MSKKSTNLTRGGLALLAAGIAGVMPATVGQATPTEQGAAQARQSTAKSERAALPGAQSARAAVGQQAMSGGYDPRLWMRPGAPWEAPRYNQRKARRDARRVNRKVVR